MKLSRFVPKCSFTTSLGFWLYVNDPLSQEQSLHSYRRILLPLSSLGVLLSLGASLWHFQYSKTKTSSKMGFSQGFLQTRDWSLEIIPCNIELWRLFPDKCEPIHSKLRCFQRIFQVLALELEVVAGNSGIVGELKMSRAGFRCPISWDFEMSRKHAGFCGLTLQSIICWNSWTCENLQNYLQIVAGVLALTYSKMIHFAYFSLNGNIFDLVWFERDTDSPLYKNLLCPHWNLSTLISVKSTLLSKRIRDSMEIF